MSDRFGMARLVIVILEVIGWLTVFAGGLLAVLEAGNPPRGSVQLALRIEPSVGVPVRD